MSFVNLTKFLWRAVLTEMVVHAAPSHNRQLRTHWLPSLSGVIGVCTINLCAPVLRPQWFPLSKRFLLHQHVKHLLNFYNVLSKSTSFLQAVPIPWVFFVGAYFWWYINKMDWFSQIVLLVIASDLYAVRNPWVETSNSTSCPDLPPQWQTALKMSRDGNKMEHGINLPESFH